MDSYNRGYGASVALPTVEGETELGEVTIYETKGDPAAEAIGFYAIAYELESGQKIRGCRS